MLPGLGRGPPGRPPPPAGGRGGMPPGVGPGRLLPGAGAAPPPVFGPAGRGPGRGEALAGLTPNGLLPGRGPGRGPPGFAGAGAADAAGAIGGCAARSAAAALAAVAAASCAAFNSAALASAAATSTLCELAMVPTPASTGALGPGFGPGAAGPGRAAGGLGRPGTADGLAGEAAGALAGAPPEDWDGNDSRRRRATGASTVDDADFTNSPSSFSRASTTLLSTPSSLASSCTRALPATGLLIRGRAATRSTSCLQLKPGHCCDFIACSYRSTYFSSECGLVPAQPVLPSAAT